MIRKHLIVAATIAALSATSSIYSLIILDDVMNKDTQQITGVSKMTPNQKIALEAWLNQNFILKTPSPSFNQATPYLSLNINNGEQLQLSDGTLWDISPDDVSTASSWISPVPITITQSGNPSYPMLLVNNNTGASVKGRKAQAPMTTPTPAPNMSPPMTSPNPAMPQQSPSMTTPPNPSMPQQQPPAMAPPSGS
jgi:hypothetical protein